MNKINVTKQIWLLIGFMCLSIFGISSFGYFQASSLFNKLNLVSTKYMPAMQLMDHTDMMHDNIKANVYSAFYFFESKDEKSLEISQNENNEAIDSINKNLQEIKKLHLSDKTNATVESAGAKVVHYAESSRKIIESLKNKNIVDAKILISQFNVGFDDLEAELGNLSDSVKADSVMEAASGSFVLNIILFSSIFALVFCFAIGYLTINQISKNLKKYTKDLENSSNKVNSISSQLSAANVQLSSSTTESAGSLEETVASLEELSSMVNLNTDNSKKAFEASEEAKLQAERGDLLIQELTTAMNQMKSDSKKMEDIVNVIDDISFQTNLLALNAAVEAARAGEQGKGFAVVADAVRTLAQRSSTSAKEIHIMIKDNLSKVEKGTTLADSCNHALKTILGSVKNLNDLSGQIAQASAEQFSGLKQINQAMIQLDTSAQENAKTAESLSMSASEASSQSNQMSQVVQNLNTFIFGDTQFESLQSRSIEKNEDYKVVELHKVSRSGASLALDLGPEPDSRIIKKVENF